MVKTFLALLGIFAKWHFSADVFQIAKFGQWLGNGTRILPNSGCDFRWLVGSISDNCQERGGLDCISHVIPEQALGFFYQNTLGIEQNFTNCNL